FLRMTTVQISGHIVCLLTLRLIISYHNYFCSQAAFELFQIPARHVWKTKESRCTDRFSFKAALARQALPLPSPCKKTTVEKSFVSVETSGFPFPLYRTFAPAVSRARVVS
ncbi:MAG: hypothetical protein LUF77_03125, partial [Oscillospiraceae bacterium]|nr:hypothetical protein [Oscillospiraceae bacterium]